jgi:hypothetical protein
MSIPTDPLCHTIGIHTEAGTGGTIVHNNDANRSLRSEKAGILNGVLLKPSVGTGRDFTTMITNQNVTIDGIVNS